MIINSIKKKININDIKRELLIIKNWEIKYKYIIELGNYLIKMPDTMKKDINLVNGCQNKVWCNLIFNKNKIFIYIDSNSLIIKGLISILFIYLNKINIKKDKLNFINFHKFINNLDFLKNFSLTRYYGLLYVEKLIESKINKYLLLNLSI